MPVNFGRIRKYTIPAGGNTVNKHSIRQTIMEQYPYYEYVYLMNPYKYFEEV